MARVQDASSSEVAALSRRGVPATRSLERLTPPTTIFVAGRQPSEKERAAPAQTRRRSCTGHAWLVDARAVDWQDRAHFFAVSSTIMRRILVDAARARGSSKRGGDLQRVEETPAFNLDSLPATGTDRAAEICALNDALDALAHREPRRAKVIELRYFGGLSVEETAEALGVSPQTVLRDWKLARAWLAVELRNARRP